MPINTEERTKLELAVASFEEADSVAVARLIYETLHASRAAKENPGGLGVDHIMALGRLIYDKSEWPALAQVEEAMGKRPMRFPLMRAVETTFRANLANSLPKLPEEHRQALSAALTKMDPDELKLLTVLIYDTILEAPFVTGDPKKTGEMHPIAKWLLPGWSWEQLKTMEPVVKGVCIPLIEVCHTYFREHFPTIFREEAVPEAEQTVTPAAAPSESQVQEPKIEAQPEIKPDEEEAAASDAEGEASNSDPFADDSQESVAVQAQAEDDDTHTPEPPLQIETKPEEKPPEPMMAIPDEPQIEKVAEKPVDSSEPIVVATTVVASTVTPDGQTHQNQSVILSTSATRPDDVPPPETNGMHLSKKQQRRKDREEASKS